MATLDHLVSVLLTRLAWTSLQAAVLAGIVALLVRLLPRLPAAARCMLWWLVGLQAVFGLFWHAPVRLPLLAAMSAPAAAPADAMPRFEFAQADTASAGTAAPLVAMALAPSRAAAAPTASASPFRWHFAVAALWLLGLLAQLPALLVQRRRMLALRREAQPLADARLQAWCAQQAHALGLRRCPALRTTPAIASPQVSGLWRPVILWPAAHRLSQEESALALAHELAHLRRGDLWLGWIPALAQRLFFFHPLLRWMAHEYALHREAACDAQVLQRQRSAPQDYGRLLLRLGVAYPLHAGLAGASPTFHNLKRRLLMLQQTHTAAARACGWLLVAFVALAGVLPYRVTAAAGAAAQVDPVPPPPPPLPPPAPPTPPTPPTYAAGFHARHMDIYTSADARDGFALADGDSLILSGTQRDADAVRRLQKQGEPMLWFRRGGTAWLVRDAGYIQRAKAIYAPIAELGRQQAALSGQQGQLSGRQAALSAQQGALGQRQAMLGGKQALLSGQEAQLSGKQALLDARGGQPGDRAELDAGQARLKSGMQELDRQQAELDRQQQALGGKQAELGKQQAALGEQQAALGKRRSQAAEQAREQIGKLLDEAVQRGAARKLDGAARPAAASATTSSSSSSSIRSMQRDSDITTEEPGGQYAYALYDSGAHSETATINGNRRDVAAAKRLHAGDASPMFWFRNGDAAWLIRDRAYVDLALKTYAPVTAYWRDAGVLKGEQSRLEGELEGLRDRRRDIDEQRRDLRADRDAPAAAQRLASLDAQQRDVDARTADLRRQQAALQPRVDAMGRRQQQVIAQANQAAARLVDEARREGLAQASDRR
ncbi:M56 family metallopeptidase [Frateuria sp. Soil773]|uniref:M56 family metallopeptidase n=1 Tax=Frateuria sp. Soil773 TaxID=1736407 RepID=UPI000A57DBD2|nr:M56 family metallopeptidase [Frateuria sp. Soil773]